MKRTKRTPKRRWGIWKTTIGLLTVTAAALVMGLFAIGAAAADSARTCDGLVPTIWGTGSNDRIQGTPGNDVIMALGGHDQIWSQGGNDVICSGSGNDKIWAGGGNDKVFSGVGDDEIRGNSGDDQLHAGPGNDRVFGADGHDLISLADGNDFADGGNQNDSIYGGNGTDRLFGQAGHDLIRGGGHNDYLSGGYGPDRLFGDGGNDDLKGDAQDDQLYGGPGNDRLDGGNHNDRVDGGSEKDLCTGEVIISCENPVEHVRPEPGIHTCSTGRTYLVSKYENKYWQIDQRDNPKSCPDWPMLGRGGFAHHDFLILNADECDGACARGINEVIDHIEDAYGPCAGCTITIDGDTIHFDCKCSAGTVDTTITVDWNEFGGAEDVSAGGTRPGGEPGDGSHHP